MSVHKSDRLTIACTVLAGWFAVVAAVCAAAGVTVAVLIGEI